MRRCEGAEAGARGVRTSAPRGYCVRPGDNCGDASFEVAAAPPIETE
jgi:hypothetical protein